MKNFASLPSVPGFTLLALLLISTACADDSANNADTCAFAPGDPTSAQTRDVTTLALSPDGQNLWIGTADSGLFHITLDANAKPSSTTQHTTTDGLASDSIETVMVGADGEIWVSHGRASCPNNSSGYCGLSRYDQNVWTTEQGLLDDRILALAQSPDGQIWAGTHLGALLRVGSSWDAYFDWQDCNNPGDHCSPLFSFSVEDITFDNSNAAWLAIDQMALGVSPKPGGVARRAQDGATDTWDRDDDLPSNRATSVAILDDIPWAASSAGIASLDLATQTWTTAQDAAARDLLAQGSVLWAATDTGALRRAADGSWQTWTTAEGLPSDTVRAVAAADDLVCLGTAGGAACYRADTCAWSYP